MVWMKRALPVCLLCQLITATCMAQQSDPQLPETKPSVFGTESTLSVVQCFQLAPVAERYMREGDLAQAERLYLKMLESFEHTCGAAHLNLLHPLEGLATIAERRGMLLERIAYMQKALEIARQSLPADHPQIAQLSQRFLQDCPGDCSGIMSPGLIGRAEEPKILFAQGKQPEAPGVRDWMQSAGLLRKGELSPQAARRLAQVSIALGELEKAEALLLSLLEPKLRENRATADTLQLVFALAEVLTAQGKSREMEELLSRVSGASFSENAGLSGDPRLGADQARLLIEAGRLAEAEALLLEALEFAQKKGGEDRALSQLRFVLAVVYHRQGRTAEAKPLLAQLEGEVEQWTGGHQGFASAWTSEAYGNFLGDIGETAKAEKYLARAQSLRQGGP